MLVFEAFSHFPTTCGKDRRVHRSFDWLGALFSVARVFVIHSIAFRQSPRHCHVLNQTWQHNLPKGLGKPQERPHEFAAASTKTGFDFFLLAPRK
jgi:hypothetical protein